ncbi:hypothetical protein GGR52DRAFT_473407 [Hypoxylon sp. FL1284]|nr:hypothetical protein GGR52DRAFT_473407 [Hypoxylon sp. FL1284]
MARGLEGSGIVNMGGRRVEGGGGPVNRMTCDTAIGLDCIKLASVCVCHVCIRERAGAGEGTMEGLIVRLVSQSAAKTAAKRISSLTTGPHAGRPCPFRAGSVPRTDKTRKKKKKTDEEEPSMHARTHAALAHTRSKTPVPDVGPPGWIGGISVRSVVLQRPSNAGEVCATGERPLEREASPRPLSIRRGPPRWLRFSISCVAGPGLHSRDAARNDDVLFLCSGLFRGLPGTVWAGYTTMLVFFFFFFYLLLSSVCIFTFSFFSSSLQHHDISPTVCVKRVISLVRGEYYCSVAGVLHAQMRLFLFLFDVPRIFNLVSYSIS